MSSAHADASADAARAADLVARAERIADEVLWPDAAAVDRADAIPPHHPAALDVAGLTGFVAAGPSLDEWLRVTAALAGGCLATAFVWIQHQGALGAVLGGDAALRDRFAQPLVEGRMRAGLAITALRPPSPLTIRRHPAGFRLTGDVPWVTGWDAVDLLLVAAVDDAGLVHVLLADATPAPTMRAERLPLIAADASRTVRIRFEDHPVPLDRLVSTQPLVERRAADAAGLAGNGGLALGVAGRALRLAGEPLDEVDAARAALVTAEPEDLPSARAAASELALRAGARLTAVRGGGSVVRGGDAERLLREAQFLLVFGTRPAIRAALLARLAPRIRPTA